jgi:hypothetical protein
MSLTVFLTLLLLAVDLVIYSFFHRLYGDQRNALAREVAAIRGHSPAFPRS